LYAQVNANPALRLVPGSGATYVTIAMNTTKWPTSDVRVRMAIGHALDYEKCISLVGDALV